MFYSSTKGRYLLFLLLVFMGSGSALPLFAQNTAEVAHLKRRIASSQGDIRAHVDYQDLLLKMSRRQELLQEYKIYLDKEPGRAIYIYLYGRLLTSPKETLKYMKRAVSKDATLFQARVDLGRAYYHTGEYDLAISHYNAALEMRPTSAFVRNLLGLAYYHKGHADRAVIEYERAIENNNRYLDAYLNLGLTYFYTGKIDEAIRVYQQALELNAGEDDRHFIYRNLGMAYAQKGEIDQAEQAYVEALKFSPDYAEAYVSLGNLAFNQGKYQTAIEKYNKAVINLPNDPSLRLKLGLAYFNEKAFGDAIQNLQKTVELDSAQTDAYYYLGLASFNEGRNDLAMNALETYVEKERRFSRNAVVFKAKQLIDDLKRIQIRDLYSP
ncbi:MAG: tetratricopeptide repeat protein [bacterium]|nr:tetratricopeptide repeat protein [bacterium]